MRRLLLVALTLTLGSPAVSDQNDPELDRLFGQLAAAQTVREAAPLEQQIWSRWLDAGRADVDASLSRGMAAMNAGNLGAALLAFDEVVALAPDFAEGWNKRATLHFLMGSFDASVRDIERTLALEPRHFGALSGLAMIREAQGRPFEALEALERVTRVHPQLPHLKQRVDQLSEQLGDPI